MFDEREGQTSIAYLISGLATPLDHLRYGLLIHAPARLSNGIDDGEVGLKRVQRGHGILSIACQKEVNQTTLQQSHTL